MGVRIFDIERLCVCLCVCVRVCLFALSPSLSV